jgi:oligopeptidase B
MLLAKKNTFTDFIACAEYLGETGWCDPARVFGMGESAGGLLIGAVANMRPDLWRGLVAGVPFVDVVTTMMDETIPLTTGEYSEWGNPADRIFFDYMLSYSPYDNVAPVDYPAMLVTAGLYDSQVGYWEPAKWVASMRHTGTGREPLLFITNMGAGHGGSSGRYSWLEDMANQYAFLIELAGLNL